MSKDRERAAVNGKGSGFREGLKKCYGNFHVRIDPPPKKIMVLGWDFLINLEISEGKIKIFQSVLKKWSNVQQN